MSGRTHAPPFGNSERSCPTVFGTYVQITGVLVLEQGPHGLPPSQR
jgi:hypothetical protein